jgi:hypothetical protein
MLEASKHGDTSFVTLTYSDDALPKNGSLSPEDHKNFMKRFRKSVEPRRIRFYMVGEYGDVVGRPHYHYAMFGWPHCYWGRSRYRLGHVNCCEWCDRLRDRWQNGFIESAELTQKSAAYVARYVVKGLNAKDDPRLKPGCCPEFARMSNRPGIGASAMDDVALVLANYEYDATDVPSFLYHGRKKWPLGRYLQRKLRKALERDEETPQEIQAQWQAELFALRLAAKADEAFPSVKQKLLDQNKGARASAEARHEIFKQRSTL